MLRRRTADDTHPFRTGRQLIGAEVQVEGGSLALLTPIRAYAFPGAVDRFELEPFGAIYGIGPGLVDTEGDLSPD